MTRLLAPRIFFRLVLVAICWMVVSTAVFAEALNPFKPYQPNPELKKQLDAGAGRYQLSQISPAAYQALYKGLGSHAEISLPTTNGTITLMLDQTQDMMATKGFEVTERNGKSTKSVAYQYGRYYQGKIDGDAGSNVAISFFENGQVIGVAYSSAKGGNLVIGRIEQKDKPFLDRPLVVFDDQDLKAKNNFLCGQLDDDGRKPKQNLLPQYGQQAKSVNATCKSIKFYLEGGYTLYQAMGNSVIASTNHLTGIFNVVNNLYNVERVHISINRIQINSALDNIPTATSRDVLFAFRDNLVGGFPEDLAHYFTANLGLGGVAYLGVLCEPQVEFRTGMSDVNTDFQTLPLYSWSANVTAHEIGHNIGSPHTQWCGWDKGNGVIGNIDSCYATEPDASSTACYTGPTVGRAGTVMSYCHLTGSVDLANGFGPLPSALLRGSFDNATCLTGLAAPAITITAAANQCPGENVNLTVTSVPGATYIWRGPNGFTALGNPALLANFDDTKSGVYSVEVQVNGCTYSPFPVSIKSKCINFASPKLLGAVCNGDNLPINFTIGTPTTPTTVAVLQLGNGTGSFGVPTVLGTYTNQAVVNTSAPISGFAEGTYRLRIALTHKGVTTFEYLPLGIGIINKTATPTTPTPVSTCPNKSVTLTAPTNGFANQWVSSGGSVVGTANTFATPNLTNNTTYSLRQTETINANVGSANPANGSYRVQAEVLYNFLRVYRPMILNGFRVDADAAGSVTIVAQDSVTGAIVATATRTVVPGINNISGLNLNIPAGVYRLKGTGTTVGLFRTTSAPGFPFRIAGVCEMAGSNNSAGFNTDFYYWFYNLSVSYGRCQSASANYVINVSSLAQPTITNIGSTSLCQGGSVTLEAPTGAGLTYLWSNNATTRTINVTAGGSYTVQTIAGTCTSAASAATVVTVNTRPTTPAITSVGATTFCQGGSVTLEAPTGTGLTYLWSNNATTRTIDVTTGGSYTVQTIVGTCTSSVSAATIVTVNPAPTLPTITAVGATTFCQGGSVTLEAPTGTGLTYLWSNNATTRTIDVTTGGTYTVQTIAGTCTSLVSAATIVTVNPVPTLPTITAVGATTFCQGGSVTLEAPTGTGLTYLWSNNATTRIINVTSGGSYTVQTIAGTCTSSVSAATIVTVNPVPTLPTITAVGATTFCQGGTVTLEAPTGTGLTYLWSNNATTRTINVTSGGSYTVQTIAGTCTSLVSAATIVTVNPVPTLPTITAVGATTFCQGGTVTLEAPTGTGLTYLWSNNATTRTIDVTTGGSYTVQTIAGTCTSSVSAATIVTVNPVPTLPNITANGPTTFCQGGTVTLEAPTGAGLTYLWSNNATTRTINVTAGGSYTVQTIAGTCTSSVSAATIVTVNPVPTLPTITAVGATTFCQGGSVTLEAPTGTGLTYLWSNNATTRTIDVTTGGTYTVQSIAGTCTSSVSAATIVTVNPVPTLPTITAVGATTFCQGGSVTLEAPTGTGLTYLWSNNATTRTIDVTTGGSYTVQTIAGTCTSLVSAATVVTVNPLPTAPTITRSADTLSIVALPGLTITWLLNGNPVVGNGTRLTITQTGNYTATVTTPEGCDATSPILSVLTELPVVAQSRLMVYPNPTSGLLNLDFGVASQRNIQIRNVLGQVVLHQAISTGTTILDLTDLAAGTYWIEATSLRPTKFVKQ